MQRDRVRLGSVSPARSVPAHITRPDYVTDGRVTTPRTRQIHDAESLVRLRTAGRVAAEVLLEAGEAVAPGVTTDEIDAVAHAAYLERGAYPSDLHYNGFTKSVCTSVNGVICHGIPDDRPLVDGDIVNIDVTAFVDGMHGDTSATFGVGTIDEPTRALVDTTREATMRGIAAVAPGEPLFRIGEAIEPFARSRGFTVVREYGGHGIGATFHAAPHIFHHVQPGDDELFEVGMSFTVEPMLLSGGSCLHPGRRRVDRARRRRHGVGPVRAHRGGDRDWRRDHDGHCRRALCRRRKAGAVRQRKHLIWAFTVAQPVILPSCTSSLRLLPSPLTVAAPVRSRSSSSTSHLRSGCRSSARSWRRCC
ncbi:MAG: type I methionyl aminopeptidase [Actinomycetota bacterium]